MLWNFEDSRWSPSFWLVAFFPDRIYLGTTAEKETSMSNDDDDDRRNRGSRVRSAGSDESQIRERNELADGRDEPVYSRPTFPSGTSNLNYSHQNGASSSSGRRWVLHRWDTNPTCSSTSGIVLVHTGSYSDSIIVHLFVLFVFIPTKEICRRSSSFRKSPLIPAVWSSIMQECNPLSPEMRKRISLNEYNW